jgi:hypothetical protein
MANKNGSNAAVLDIQGAIAQQEKRTARLVELDKQRTKLLADKAKIEALEAKLTIEATSLLNGGPVTAPKATKPAKGEKTEKTGKRGRPVGSTNGTCTSLREVLLKVMPNADEQPINKDEIASRVAAAGYTSTASDPKIVIGQTLGRFNDFTNVERGQWRLSKHGMNRRDKAAATPEVETPAAVAETPAVEAAAPAETAAV